MMLRLWRFATLVLTMMFASVAFGYRWRWLEGYGPADWSTWLPAGIGVPEFPPEVALVWGGLAAVLLLAVGTRGRGFSHLLTVTSAVTLGGFCATRWLGFHAVDLALASSAVADPTPGWQAEVFNFLVAWNGEQLFAVGGLALLLMSVLAETPVATNGASFSPAARLRQFWCGWTSAAEEDELTFEQWRSRVFDHRWALMREAS